MQGLLLAAGSGRRLESVFPGKPKCLLPFGPKTLLGHQLHALKKAGITDVTIVVGYEQDQIRAHLGDWPYPITYVQNPIFDRTNTLYSLWLARHCFGDDFIYFNADVLFDYRIINSLIDAPGTNLACVRKVCGDEEVKVVTEGTRIKEIGKKMSPDRCFGEFIGIAHFAKEDNARFLEIVDTCVEDKANWGNFFEYAVDFLAREKQLNCIDISSMPATEIDFPQDLEYARTAVLPLLNFDD